MKLPLAITVALLSKLVCWCPCAANAAAEPGTDDAPTAPATLDAAKSTVVVATLDAPIPEGRNAIWCASFLAAWKTLAEQVTQGPISLDGAEDLAGVLNGAADPRPDVPKEALYVAAGRVRDGIIDRIQREVVQKFPHKKVPTFSEVATTVAYAYLEASVKFPEPYFQNPEALEFTDSTGRKAPVASFGICPKGESYRQPRSQPRILFDKGADEKLEFAIDLDPDSKPSQIVVARIDREPTLAAALARVNKEAKAVVKSDSSLGPDDVMLVPDLFWEIAHHFADLEGATFASPRLAGLPLGVARQDILFQLGRCGAILKSEGRLEEHMGDMDLPTPKLFLCDHPFLIFMRQRGADAPYFAMWVDNAEVLTRSGHVSTPLHEAALKGDKAAAELLLADHAGANARDERGTTPLHQAARGGHTALVELLLANQAGVNARDERGTTPLHHAAQNGHPTVVELLLAKGAGVDDWDDAGNMPLYLAAQNGHRAVVELLVAKGAGVDDWGGGGNTPLHAAAEKGHTDTVAFLLAKGAEVDAINDHHETPLLLAAGGGHKEVVELLLAEGAATKSRVGSDEFDPNRDVRGGIKGTTPLHLAAARGDQATVALLLAKGANVNDKDRAGETPLYYPAACGDQATVAVLLANVYNMVRGGRTPLHYAAARGAKPTVELLLAKGAGVNDEDGDGRTPLHYAAACGDKATVELLLAKGAGVDDLDDDGNMPLYLAAQNGHPAVAELLLDKGAGVDDWGKHSNTPLHAAAEKGHSATVAFLLANGAEIDAINDHCETPLLLAASGGHKEEVELLLAKGAEVDPRNRLGFTPLLAAAQGGHKDAAAVLLTKGADVNVKDKSGKTALHWARESKNKELVALLLAHHAADTIEEAVMRGDLAQVKALLKGRPGRVREKDAFGRTALHSAACNNLKDMAAWLLANGAEVNAKDSDGITPLHFAVSRPNGLEPEESRKDLVALLLANGAEVNAKDKGGRTPLQWTAAGDYFKEMPTSSTEVLELLLVKGADANARIHQETIFRQHAPSGQDTLGRDPFAEKSTADAKSEQGTALEDKQSTTLLHIAAATGNTEIVKTLLAHHAEVNAKDAEGSTPLHLAALLGRPQVAELLLTHHADVSVKNIEGKTPLQLAHRHRDVEGLLVAHGAELDILEAIRMGKLEKVRSLLEGNPELARSNDRGWTPLHLATFWNAPKALVELLLAKGAEVNAADSQGETPLLRAAGGGRRDVVELLLAKGAEVNAGAGDGTPLNFAAGGSDRALVELLLAHHAEVNPKNRGSARFGGYRMPLHWAARRGSKDIVELLLARQAEVDARTDEGETALHLAMAEGHQDVVELLLAHQADINAKDSKEGSTPLHLAVKKANKELVELLLAKGADVNARDRGGSTPLLLAAVMLWPAKDPLNTEHEYPGRWGEAPGRNARYPREIPELLVAKGADVLAKNDGGWTAMDVAVRNGRRGAAQRLLGSKAEVDTRNH